MSIYRPDVKLANFIECYWTVPHAIGKILQSQEIMTQGTSIELIFDADALPHIFLIRGANFIGHTGNCCLNILSDPNPIFGIRFKVNGLYPFSKFSLKDFTITPLQRPGSYQGAAEPRDILGDSVEYLAEHLQESRTIADKIKIANQFFIRRLPEIRPVDYFVDHLVNELYTKNGLSTVDQLSVKYNVNKKTIERRFVNTTGFNPKEFSQIIRFNCMLKICNYNSAKQVKRIIYDLGYYDNAHFQKDFKKFTKLTPSAFFSKNYRVLQVPTKTQHPLFKPKADSHHYYHE